MERLIEVTETNLYLLCKTRMSREEAIAMKQRLTAPLGILNSQHGLQSEHAAKRALRKGLTNNG